MAQKNQTSGGTQSTDGGTDGSQTDDLELDADDDLGDGTDGDSSQGTDGDEDDNSVEAQVARGIAAALPKIQQQFQSEMDRRINKVVKTLGKKQTPPDGQDDDDEDDQRPARRRTSTPQADVRGARVALRDYLPNSIKFLSSEERTMALEYGSLLITAEAAKGFEDEDMVGRDVAQRVAEHVRTQRKFYSERTKRTLERQGVLVKQEGNGSGGGNGGTPPPPTTEEAWKKAEAVRRQMFPHQFKDDKK